MVGDLVVVVDGVGNDIFLIEILIVIGGDDIMIGVDGLDVIVGDVGLFGFEFNDSEINLINFKLG